MRLLLVEDEKRTTGYLRKGLAENGYVVDTAHDGRQGLQLALTGTYDLLILDINLPLLDGWSILQELRGQGVATPALYLSARDLVADKVKGLGLGADDYLVKPFAFSELLARLQTIARRTQTRPPEMLRTADLELNLAEHSAKRAGRTLNLTPRDFRLLSLLLRRKGETLSRTTILEQVWKINFDTETNVVEVAIGRLRRKVDEGSRVPLILTVRGFGYTLKTED